MGKLISATCTWTCIWWTCFGIFIHRPILGTFFLYLHHFFFAFSFFLCKTYFYSLHSFIADPHFLRERVCVCDDSFSVWVFDPVFKARDAHNDPPNVSLSMFLFSQQIWESFRYVFFFCWFIQIQIENKTESKCCASTYFSTRTSLDVRATERKKKENAEKKPVERIWNS